MEKGKINFDRFSNSNEFDEYDDIHDIRDEIGLEVLLPISIEMEPSGKITVDIENEEEGGYYFNTEYTLEITEDNGKINIDYYGEDDTYLSNINDSDWTCTKETYIKKQYEIASELGIDTLDIKKPRYLD